MKKRLGVFLLLGSVFLLSRTLYAFPFIEVQALVNPSTAKFTDLGNGTSQVSNLNYSFTVSDSWFGAEMYLLSLEFEKDDFKSVSRVYDYDPSGWGRLTLWGFIPNSHVLSFALDSAATVGVGETLSFAVDAIMFNSALSDPSVWRQSWLALDTRGGGDGGSTATTPEPAAMLLYGAGLVVLGFAGRKLKLG